MNQTAVNLWRWSALSVYLSICLFDFMIVPLYMSYQVPYLEVFVDIINRLPDDPLVRLDMMKIMTGVHDPFTLKGGGIFHLAFGALLTGTAMGISSDSKKD
jgi:hypothetical protein|tara:strand:- start:202 stop:504 length:303 start_codon:yes stop_codon:yes gene_type:complete